MIEWTYQVLTLNNAIPVASRFATIPQAPHMPLGYHMNTLNIPLFMEGTIATMSTRFPSMEELESRQYIYLSDQEIWDPSNVNFKLCRWRRSQDTV